MLTASNQAVTILKQLGKQLSFQKSIPNKHANATANFSNLPRQFKVGSSYNPVIAAKQSFENILITEWSCANKFYVLIGSPNCQLSV